jgi:hypothetical protein
MGGCITFIVNSGELTFFPKFRFNQLILCSLSLSLSRRDVIDGMSPFLLLFWSENRYIHAGNHFSYQDDILPS